MFNRIRVVAASTLITVGAIALPGAALTHSEASLNANNLVNPSPANSDVNESVAFKCYWFWCPQPEGSPVGRPVFFGATPVMRPATEV
jgi:hypothetical protein